MYSDIEDWKDANLRLRYEVENITTMFGYEGILLFSNWLIKRISLLLTRQREMQMIDG